MIKEGKKKREKTRNFTCAGEEKKKENWRGKFHARRESQESTT